MKVLPVFNFVYDWRKYLAEFLGTFAFVFIASCAVLTNIFYAELGAVGVGLIIGFSYAALLYATNHIGGGYLNPAVTLALWLGQRIGGLQALFFLVVQVLAGFAAAGLLVVIFGQGALEFSLGGPTLGVNVTPAAALIVEAAISAILVFVVFATAVDRAGPISFSPLALGLVLAAASIFSWPISGAGINPARVIGLLVVSKSFSNLAIWIVGPLCGSLVGLVYEFAFLKKKQAAK